MKTPQITKAAGTHKIVVSFMFYINVLCKNERKQQDLSSDLQALKFVKPFWINNMDIKLITVKMVTSMTDLQWEIYIGFLDVLCVSGISTLPW